MRFKFGSAYEGYDTSKGKIILLNIMMFYIRRACLVYTVIYQMKNLTLQVVTLFVTTLVQVVIIASFDVYASQAANRAELINEVFTMFIMYGTFLFTDYVPDSKVKFILGYLFSAFILMHLVLNLAFIVSRNISISTRAWKAKRQLKIDQNRRAAWR